MNEELKEISLDTEFLKKNLNKKQYDDKIREMRNEKDIHKISEKLKKIAQ